MTSDTIAAISTPFGEGAIALLRLSGSRALAIADAVFTGSRKPSESKSRVQQLGKITDGETILDSVLLTVHRAPHSYTGEEMVEISCHGGILVTRRILELLLDRGARSAEPGEFTQRAFLNGKMDLTQAEAVMDLIQAQTDLALRAASAQLEGRLGSRIAWLRESLLDITAHVEAYIDFPDEEIEPNTGAALLEKIDAARAEILRLLDTAAQGRILREGVRTVIYGAPNAGKSSLLNFLLGSERAIVSHLPGTTRDTIEEVINLRGIPLRLIDTAGIRESTDEIEKEGIARTLRSVESADLLLHIVDASRPGETSREPERNPREILILNKIDLGEDSAWKDAAGVRISCLTGSGLDTLGETIFNRVMGGGINAADPVVAINARHQACLKKAGLCAAAAAEGLRSGAAIEIIAAELRGAMDAVGEIAGKADAEEILGRIFSTFCIGK